LPAAASARYDITVVSPILPGSAFLQACFYGLAAAIVVAAIALLKRAAIESGSRGFGFLSSSRCIAPTRKA
jgi:hypothetical protein